MNLSRIKDKSYHLNLKIEQELWSENYQLIAGIDEAGRGPFAGPLVAGAVIMPKGFRLEKLTDSKKINKNYHAYFAELVKEKAVAFGIGVVDVQEFDNINYMIDSTRLAMKRAVENLGITPDYLLVDGNEKVELPITQQSVVKGDYFSHSISAGAIIAKVHRDKIMEELDKEYDYKYDWTNNVGYLTKGHIERIHQYGLTKYHRHSWTEVCERFKKQP